MKGIVGEEVPGSRFQLCVRVRQMSAVLCCAVLCVVVLCAHLNAVGVVAGENV
jgi:hypothetical protein